MKRLFHEYIFYNRAQRQGILALTFLILAVIAADRGYLYYRNLQAVSSDTLQQNSNTKEELQQFLSSLQPRQQSPISKRATAFTPIHRTEFDPNTADSASLLQMGLPAWMVKNILKYRAKGGRFRQAEDFKKVYGLKEELYAELLPYIKIAPDTFHLPKKENISLLMATSADSSKYTPIEKYSPGTMIELNSADTTELKKIPGIGSGIAQKIVRYREQLGGFYSLKQLQEIRLNYQLLTSWLQIDESKIHRIPINRASIAQLNRHPYINFYQAKALMTYRNKKGHIRNLKPFSLLEEFTSQDLDRLTHYLDFSEK